jgi:hypothetical protein
MAERDSEAVRQPDPGAAAQDPRNAARQDQLRRDHDAIVAHQQRVEASVPEEIKGKTVGEIVDEAEERADRDRE